MPRITYVRKEFRGSSLDIIRKANAVCAAYAAQGLDLTLRQLYYQFVSRGWIENTIKSYKRLGSIVNDARLAGYIDWDYIVDRTRSLASIGHWGSPAGIIRSASRSYAEDKWANQENYVEVWIEKNALVGVLDSVCPQNDVPYFACVGYPSQSEVWAAGNRLREKIEAGKRVKIIHLGDHDPSGIDMSRDIEDRLRMFIACDYYGASPVTDAEEAKEDYWQLTSEDLDIDRIALNEYQVRQYNPPPNPAKITDTRAKKYIERFGIESWELDALDPATLVDLIQTAIDGYRDEEAWQEAVEHEEEQRKILTKASAHWEQVAAFLDSLSDR